MRAETILVIVVAICAVVISLAIMRKKKSVACAIVPGSVVFRFHDGWGNAIGWLNDDDSNILCGFKSYPSTVPKVGDIFVSRMKSGQEGMFYITSFNRPWPKVRDYFEAETVKWKYVCQLTEEERLLFDEGMKP